MKRGQVYLMKNTTQQKATENKALVEKWSVNIHVHIYVYVQTEAKAQTLIHTYGATVV